jgi:hypothetical protein
MVNDVRPVHLEMDCTTGIVTSTPMTDEEWAAHREKEAAYLAEVEKQAAAEKQLSDTVAAHPDPIVRELGRRLGLGVADD